MAKKNIEIKDFITGKVTYDKFGGQYFWINNPSGGCQMLAEMRGYGHIQNMCKDTFDKIDMDQADQFQDRVGEWIAEAINEKMQRESQPQPIEGGKCIICKSPTHNKNVSYCDRCLLTDDMNA